MSRFLGLGNGQGGVIDLSSYTQTWYSCSGSEASHDLTVTGTFSPGDRVFIHQSRGGSNVGKYEDNTVASYTSGTLTLVHPLENDYTDSGAEQAQIAVVKEASKVTGTYTFPAWDGNIGGIFVIACNGEFSGVANGTGKGFRGGVGRSNVGNVWGYCGEGTAGPSEIKTSEAANGNGAGSSKSGSDPNHSNGGSGGSNGTSGTFGENYSDSPLGEPGDIVGDDEFSVINMGGAGSGGVKYGTPAATAGGNGGGIIVVYTQKFSDTASLISDATNGVNSGQYAACGGGGAGGSILIKVPEISIGLNLVYALGKIGGRAIPPADVANDGGDGGNGRIRIESCSVSGTTSPTASQSLGGHDYCSSGVLIY